jgi:hypothetical protein
MTPKTIGENHVIGVTTDASALWFDHDGKGKELEFRGRLMTS